jgi:hypothetical protein
MVGVWWMRVGVLVVLAVLGWWSWWAVGLGHLHVNVQSSPKLARLDRASGLALARAARVCLALYHCHYSQPQQQEQSPRA